MKLNSVKQQYTVGEFAKCANVSIRTLRYYDKIGILPPSCMSESGYRLYTNEDFAKLQRILALKYLGFSLEEIESLADLDTTKESLKNSFHLQQQMIAQKIEQLTTIQRTIQQAESMLDNENEVEWGRITDIIHAINLGQSVAKQYQTAENLKVRINLHKRFSINSQGWYPFVFEQIPWDECSHVLELAGGNGALWKENIERIPSKLNLTFTDLSSGMLSEAKENLKILGNQVSYEVMDMQNIKYDDGIFDLVIANHALFYAANRELALQEIQRVLKKGGIFVCSTYGQQHMKEIETICKHFNPKIKLSEVNLADLFGLEQGEEELSAYFSSVHKNSYQDELQVNEYRPLLDYILSCHGNQMEVLKGHYKEFEHYLKELFKQKKVIRITKQAGIFICRK